MMTMGVATTVSLHAPVGGRCGVKADLLLFDRVLCRARTHNHTPCT